MNRKGLLTGAALVVLAGLVIWSSGRKSALTEMTAANDALRERIAKAEMLQRGETSVARAAGGMWRPAFAPGEIPWQRVEEWFASEREGRTPTRELALLRIALLDFTVDELVAELDRIDQMDGSDATRFLVGDILGSKDPQRMLERFHRGFEDMEGIRRWQIQAVLQHWVAREPEAATGWLDQSIAAGWLGTRALDGIRHHRVSFETLLLSARPDDPAVAARLEQLDDHERRNLFGSLPDHRVRAGTEGDWLRKIGEYLPPAEQASAAGRIATFTLRRNAGADIGSMLDEAGLDAGVKQQVLESLQPLTP